MTDDEEKWLKQTCPYFSLEYMAFLKASRFDSKKHVKTTFDGATGQISIQIAGLWVETILYEVPLLALVSQTYFETVDMDWDMQGQQELALEKCRKLLSHGCGFSEFGTRRRRNFAVQDLVVAAFAKAAQEMSEAPGKLVGTSNVYLAMKHGLTPVGTVAHG